MSNVLRNIPSVNELLDSPPLRNLIDRASRSVVVTGVRSFLENLRTELQTADRGHQGARARASWRSGSPSGSPRKRRPTAARDQRHGDHPAHRVGPGPAGRTPRSRRWSSRPAATASLEVDLETGQRSQRLRDAERLLRKLTGAEAAAVVNNNAGATLLALAALAAGREVIVSRGQLVEIGGSYRLPEVMEFSGAKLREVGTTNKTRSDDYRGGHRARNGRPDAGPRQQLRHRRLHRAGVAGRTGRAWPPNTICR